MKLRKGDSRIVYLDAEGNESERPDMLAMVQGKTITEGKQIVCRYEKTTLSEWTDREGNVVVRTYGDIVGAIEVKPADADTRRAVLLGRLREAQAKVARPDATPQDMAEAMALQIEYLELMDQLAD